MARFFIPYSGSRPAAVSVNGHKLILLTEDRAALTKSLKLFGADRIEMVRTGDSETEREQFLHQIARSNEAGIVLAPPNTSTRSLLRTLEEQLPWVQ